MFQPSPAERRRVTGSREPKKKCHKRSINPQGRESTQCTAGIAAFVSAAKKREKKNHALRGKEGGQHYFLLSVIQNLFLPFTICTLS